MQSNDDYSVLVVVARKVVEYALEDVEDPVKRVLEDFSYIKKFNERRGVFTSIYTYPNHDLRGCIGYPLPTVELYKAVLYSSLNAAFNDPRFSPLTDEELDKVVFELSLLSMPKKLDVKSPLEYTRHIKIGRDGLILRYRGVSSILLPQVAVEYGWSVIDYLSNLSMKAGLTPDIWLDPETEIYSFTAEIYLEEEPEGNIVKRDLT